MVIKENDSFLTKFSKKDTTLIQSIKEYKFHPIKLVKLNSKDEIELMENELMQRVFDLEGEPYEWRMFKLPDGTGGYALNIHHILADGWGLGLICRKVMIAYSDLTGENIDEEISSSYIDYLKSEQEYIKSDKFKIDKNYWDNIFKTIPDSVTIPGTSTLENNSCRANRKEFILSKSLISSIQNFCAKNKISVFNFFTAVLSTYIYKITNETDFVIGTPILNRTNFKEKNTVGMFVNVSPLRINVNTNDTFIKFAENISLSSKEMLRHQKYSYTNILEDLRSKNSLIPSLYNIILSYQVTKTTTVSKYTYESRWVFSGNSSEDMEIQIYDFNESGNLALTFDYKIDKYTEEDIKYIYDRIIYIINQILEKNDIKLSQIEFATPKEREQILNKFNNTKSDYPREKSMVQLFEEQVKLNPQKRSVFFEEETLTYEELNNKANSIANYLIENGANLEDVVGIFFEKSLNTIIALLGILKAGCCYLPIDTAYPQDRIDYMIENSNTKFVLSDSKFEKILNSKAKIVNLDNFDFENIENPNLKIKPTNLAYVMYTSGSTGKPKGVMIEHRGIIRLVKNPNFLKFEEDERIIQTGTIAFDACTFEIWAALLNGYELFVIPKNTLLDPIELQKYVETNKITIIFLTTPLLHQIANTNPHIFANVRYLITGGDVLSVSSVNLIRKENPNLKIINAYGPTENSAYSTCFNIEKDFSKNVPIGYPIQNSTCYIVNSEYKLCPIQTVGELIVGGDGVGRGYLNAEELTKEKFITNLFGEKRLYKTGDLAKWLPDGSIDFLGRADSQVKIRGNRIELRRNQP